MQKQRNWWSAKELADDWGIAESSVWRLAREVPEFPKPARLTPKVTRFRDADKRAYEERAFQQDAKKTPNRHKQTAA